MISSLLSGVHILQYENLSGRDLFQALSFATGKREGLKIAAIFDNAPIPLRESLLAELAEYCTINSFDAVKPNPKSSDIQSMFDDPRFKEADLVLGIGGGSVLDSAKALAMLGTNGGDLNEYLGNSPKRKIEKKNLPLVLIPTTAGTGSEVTKVGVYSDATGRKHTLGSPLMSAHTALLVGSFLDSIPPSLCAATGLDALDHALESIWNKNATAITRSAAEAAAIAVLTHLPPLYRAIVQKKEDRRSLQKEMLVASTMAGIAFNMTGTAACHAISFILSEEWHVPHGSACAFSLLEVFDWAAENQETKSSLARIAKPFHPGTTDENELVIKLRGQIETLMQEMKIAHTFRQLGVELKQEDIPALFARSFSDPKMHNQVPPMHESDLYALLSAKL
ncbi:MAG: iron-containing alcohol dehydrogenase [Spirochaetia bacterium]|nr:iron-containing alcohol dehydrogenase [Spirochaetia bacterium]